MLTNKEVAAIMNFKEMPASAANVSRRGKVAGIGINDAWYKTSYRDGGKKIKCPFFLKWTSMLERCYSESYQDGHKTYKGCTVCVEWLHFSNFRSWMEGQQWSGNYLDKDILGNGSKIYSPKTCLFVSARVNSLFRVAAKGKTSSRLGVSLSKKTGLYMSYGWDGKKNIQLGGFINEADASQAYCDFKYKVIANLADGQPKNVKEAMLNYRIEGSAPPPVEHVASTIRNDIPKLLHARIDELEHQLRSLVYCAENNSGYVPSLCCYQHALAESKKSLEKGISV